MARATRFAFDAWGRHLASGIRPEYDGLVRVEHAARDGQSTIVLLSSWPFGDASRLVAYTEVYYDLGTGLITEADISLNGEGFEFEADSPGAMDPDSVLLHEAGHWLGLAHSCGAPGSATPSCFSLPAEERERILGAVMSPTLGPGEAKRVLTPDDLLGLRALYAQGFIETSSISLTSVERSCQPGTLVVYGQALPAEPEVFVRNQSGALQMLEVQAHAADQLVLPSAFAESSTLSFDLLVSDPSTGERASLLEPEVLAARCDGGVNPPPPETGCDCKSTEGEASGFGWALLALGFGFFRRRAWPSMLLGLFVVSAGADALAYRCSRVDFDEGPSLYWAERTIGFYVDEALVANEAQNLAFRAEISTSLATWTSVDCSDFGLEVLGIKVVRPGYNESGPNENVITFIDASEGWAYSPSIIAVTTNTFETSSGRIIDSDIEVNRHHFELVVADALPSCDPETGVMDLQNTLTHEVGHAIGLDHPPSTRTYAETTMFASAPSCETKKRSLAEDDIAGLCEIYPTGLPVAQCFPPNGPLFTVVEQDDGFGGCSTLGRGAAPERLGPLVLLGVFLGLGVRARRRHASARRVQRPKTTPA